MCWSVCWLTYRGVVSLCFFVSLVRVFGEFSLFGWSGFGLVQQLACARPRSNLAWLHSAAIGRWRASNSSQRQLHRGFSNKTGLSKVNGIHITTSKEKTQSLLHFRNSWENNEVNLMRTLPRKTNATTDTGLHRVAERTQSSPIQVSKTSNPESRRSNPSSHLSVQQSMGGSARRNCSWWRRRYVIHIMRRFKNNCWNWDSVVILGAGTAYPARADGGETCSSSSANAVTSVGASTVSSTTCAGAATAAGAGTVYLQK